MRALVLSIVFLAAQAAMAWDHGPLKCQGLYGIIGHLDHVEMPITKEDKDSTVLEGKTDKFSFKVEWNYQLDTLYTFIAVESIPKFQATMRVPTENHNDSFGECKILGEADQPWGHMLVFEDPDGNVLKLMNPKGQG